MDPWCKEDRCITEFQPLWCASELRGTGIFDDVTGDDISRDGMPDILQRPHLFGCGAALQYGARVKYGAQVSFVRTASTMAAAVVVMNFDGIPEVLGQLQLRYDVPSTIRSTGCLFLPSLDACRTSA